jgi:hypothetical protein
MTQVRWACLLVCEGIATGVGWVARAMRAVRIMAWRTSSSGDAPHPQAQARDLFARQEEDLTAFCEGVVELQTGAGIELDVAACGNGGWVPKGTSEGERG